jgi:cysteinyl-tRNA synthetase
LIFPHHENEIAQSEALTGKQFSNYWIHNGLVKINGQKMSKSLGNGISLKQLLDNYHPDVIRFVLLQNSYKSDLNIIDGIFEENEKHIYNFYKIFNAIDNLEIQENLENIKQSTDLQANIETAFDDAMSNDFNAALALSYLFQYFDKMKAMLGKNKEAYNLKLLKETIIRTYYVLGILQDEPQKIVDEIKNKYMEKYEISEEEVKSLIAKRSEYKANKDYENADKVKGILLEKGITILDGRNGTEWDVNIGKKK